MLQRLPASGSTSLDLRRKEILERLAEYRRVPHPRSRSSSGSRAITEPGPASFRLKITLENLGPLFALFGLYLSRRLDLLQFRESIELAEIRDESDDTPPSAILSLLRAELTQPPDEVFAEIDETPRRRSLLYQWHGAKLRSGERVMLKLLRPELNERVEQDLALLPLLRGLSPESSPLMDSEMAEALDDFKGWLERRLDLRYESDTLDTLAAAASDLEDLTSPRRYPEYCSSRLLVYERIEGCTLESRVPPESESEGEGAIEQTARAEDLARRLCLAWLQQALLSQRLIEDPLPENLLIMDEDRFAIIGGPLTELDSSRSHSFRTYLVAAAREEPDRVCDYLLRESYCTDATASRDELRRQFRQAEPFRDGGWSDRYSSLQLANSLFVHWRLARRGGYRPKAQLLTFYQGLAGIERISRRLSPHRDALKAALNDLRVIAAAFDVRQLAAPSRLQANAERFLPAMLELLQRVDDLAGAAEEPLEVRSEVESSDSGIERGASWLVVSSLLLLLVVMALVLGKLGGLWTERLGAVVFAGLTALLLWIVLRRRSR